MQTKLEIKAARLLALDSRRKAHHRALSSLHAKRLLAVANGETERAMAAVRAAWSRETTVSI